MRLVQGNNLHGNCGQKLEVAFQVLLQAIWRAILLSVYSEVSFIVFSGAYCLVRMYRTAALEIHGGQYHGSLAWCDLGEASMSSPSFWNGSNSEPTRSKEMRVANS